MTIKIFIGNLSSDTVTEDLQPLFERYGTVTECAVLRNFGFVHMEDENEASTAIKELTGTLIKGCRMRVEMSTGKNLRGDGAGKMGGRGRGRGGRGDFRGGMGRDRFPPGPGPAPRGRHPYAREPYPYDYYDRHYPPPPRHPAERSRPLPPDDRYPYPEDRGRLPPPPEDRYRDPRDRYLPPPSRYDRYDDRYYDRYPPPAPADDHYSRDPYERPPADYYNRYRAYDGYADPVRRPAPEEPSRYPPAEPRGRPEANGYDYDVADYRKGAPPQAPAPAPAPAARAAGGDSTYSSYYYDRFYNKQSNGAGSGAMGGSGYPSSSAGGLSQFQSKAAQLQVKKEDQQSLLQTGPIYF